MTKKSNPSFKLSFRIGFLFIGTILCVSSQQIPQAIASSHEIAQSEPIAHNVHPVSSFHIHRQGYALAYDASRRNPLWVYEHLTAENLKGTVDRSKSDFKEDENLPEHLRAKLVDYKGSGFDRGHMAPAADHKSTIEAMDDTFYMTNMCPQCPKLNRGYWARFEKHVRDLTKDYKNVYVVSGPLYLPTIEENGKRFVKYQVIGQNDIAVPTHFFKVITIEDGQGRKETRAYILPNESIRENTPLDSFRTTIQKVEKAGGLIFSN